MLPATDDPARADEGLMKAVPRNRRSVYKMRPIINSVVDQGSFFEMGRLYGRSVVTGFARVDGWPVAVLASDPSYLGGSWDAKTSEKAERFVKMADQFRLPIVHLVDNPGFMIGGEAERTGTIRYGVQAMNASPRNAAAAGITSPIRASSLSSRFSPSLGTRSAERKGASSVRS